MKYDIESIFSPLGLEIKSFKKIRTLANSVYKVEGFKKNYFLKIYEQESEYHIAEKLKNLYPLLKNEGVPVPDVIRYDNSCKLIKFPYLIITEVEGESLSSKIDSLSNNQKLLFYCDLGQVLAKIHSLTFDLFGDVYGGKKVSAFSEANFKGPFKNWKSMHKEIVDYRLSFFKGSYFEDLIIPIKNYFEKNSSLIDYNIVPRLLHIDLNQKNIFIKDNKVSGIIDFDGAFVGHNEEELMRLEGANFSSSPELKKSFFEGYCSLLELDDGYEQRRVFYYFSRLLVHIDCLIKYGSNYVKDISKTQEELRIEIEKILSGKKISYDKNK